ncbi:glycosyl hydrolase family 65 protein [Streptacidiphilus sp. PAMC 29251]
MWMMPSLLAFHPELAKSVVMQRYNTKAAAEANAARQGYAGGAWAWHNGPNGSCTDCTHNEVHLDNGVALAQWQYYEATGDLPWLRSYGYPVIRDVAAFWTSRVNQTPDGKYHLARVDSADEYANGVTDNAMTNAGAVMSLRSAVLAAQALGQSPDPRWTTIADNLNIPVDADGTHPEYVGYTNKTIKQADTVLMSYPIGYITDRAVAAADLERYMPLTDVGGPAMTASVESVIAAMAREPGCAAYTLFENSYKPFLRGPFQQFNETKNSGPSAGQGNPAFAFATGAGGFLQTFPYGLAGLRWQPDALVLDPMLPPQLGNGVTLTGLQYQGRSVTVAIGPATTTVSLASGAPITVKTPDGSHSLGQGAPLTVPTARPDQAPTLNQARCQSAAASSSGAVNLPAAAVDGNNTTYWSATSATSSLAVTLPAGKQADRVEIHWGPTRPANYQAWVQSPAGDWTQVATGAVAAAGDLQATWPSTAAQGVTLTFSGGANASVAELNVPTAGSAHLLAALSGSSFTAAAGLSTPVSLTLTSDGGHDATAVTAALNVSNGWTATPTTSTTVAALAPGSSATVTWNVTAPRTPARPRC